MKTCIKCGLEKPLSDFHLNSKAKDKKQSCCKSCGKIYQQNRVPKNPEKENARKADYSRKNREAIKEYAAKYRLENSEKRKSLQNSWRLQNLDRQRLYKQDWYQSNKERVSKKHKDWRGKTEVCLLFILKTEEQGGDWLVGN